MSGSTAVTSSATPVKSQKASNNGFEPYWNETDIAVGLEDGTLFEGVIRINPKNYKEAYIASPDGTDDILIEGLQNRNRALNGDVVICQLLPFHTTGPGTSGRKKPGTPKTQQSPKKQKNKPKENKSPRAERRVKTEKEANKEATPSKEIAEESTTSAEALMVETESGVRPQELKPKQRRARKHKDKCTNITSPVKVREPPTTGETQIKKTETENLSPESKTGQETVTGKEEPTTEKTVRLDTESGYPTVNKLDTEESHVNAATNQSTIEETAIKVEDESVAIDVREKILTEKNKEEDVDVHHDSSEPIAPIASAETAPQIKKKKRNWTRSSKTDSEQGVVDEGPVSDPVTPKIQEKIIQKGQEQPEGLESEGKKTPKKSNFKPQKSKELDEVKSSKIVTSATVIETSILVDENGVVNFKKTRRSKKKKGLDQNSVSTASVVVEMDRIVERMTGLDIVSESVTIVATEAVDANGSLDAPPRKTAKVVFIKEMKHSRRAIGQLRAWPYGQSGPVPKWVLFSPKDHRIPRLKIPFSAEIASAMAVPSMLFLGEIVSWEDVNHPLGSICYYVGAAGDIEAETLALLLEHDIDYGPFPPEVLKGLPELPWSIPQEEIDKRRDFRDQCVFTIDPSDARDLDDAVCGRFLRTAEDGKTRLFQISVHIADVSFFVREGMKLDDLASQRATSTYMVDRVIPMLPSVLCEHICSLNPGEDRLAFSVEWIINDQGEILEEWFGRSIIRSCVKLSYDHAQAVIEGREEIDWPEIKSPHTVADIKQSIEILQELAGHLRQKRVRQGALRINLPRLAFSMDWKTRTPVGFRVYELKESNRLIEEFMLLANMRVAEKIYQTFPHIAVLRCHPPPIAQKLDQLANLLEVVGIHLDVSSSAALQKSLLLYGQSSNDPLSAGRNLVISNLLAKPMKCAMYICSGFSKTEHDYRHYALSVPYYTHFTSPIRRYPDILVHRLLSAALEQDSLRHWKKTDVKKVLDNCNSRKLAAKALQEQHSELHLANLIRKSGSLEAKGIVLAVLDRSVDVVFLYLGIVRRLYLDKLPLEELVHEKLQGVGKLTLVWRPETPTSPPVRQIISVFSLLEIQLVPHSENDKLDFNLVLQRPSCVN